MRNSTITQYKATQGLSFTTYMYCIGKIFCNNFLRMKKFLLQFFFPKQIFCKPEKFLQQFLCELKSFCNNFFTGPKIFATIFCESIRKWNLEYNGRPIFTNDFFLQKVRNPQNICSKNFPLQPMTDTLNYVGSKLVGCGTSERSNHRHALVLTPRQGVAICK